MPTGDPVANTGPVVKPQTVVVVAVGGEIAIALEGEDADEDTLTYTIVRPPANGVLSGTAPKLIYTHNPSLAQAGAADAPVGASEADLSVPQSDTFAYQVSDGQRDVAGGGGSVAFDPGGGRGGPAGRSTCR